MLFFCQWRDYSWKKVSEISQNPVTAKFPSSLWTHQPENTTDVIEIDITPQIKAISMERLLFAISKHWSSSFFSFFGLHILNKPCQIVQWRTRLIRDILIVKKTTILIAANSLEFCPLQLIPSFYFLRTTLFLLEKEQSVHRKC
jgi:hypothetical protein